jgi:hypothetical protein
MRTETTTDLLILLYLCRGDEYAQPIEFRQARGHWLLKKFTTGLISVLLLLGSQNSMPTTPASFQSTVLKVIARMEGRLCIIPLILIDSWMRWD